MEGRGIAWGMSCVFSGLIPAFGSGVKESRLSLKFRRSHKPVIY